MRTIGRLGSEDLIWGTLGEDVSPSEEVETLANEEEGFLSLEEGLTSTRDVLIGGISRYGSVCER